MPPKTHDCKTFRLKTLNRKVLGLSVMAFCVRIALFFYVYSKTTLKKREKAIITWA